MKLLNEAPSIATSMATSMGVNGSKLVPMEIGGSIHAS